jgi:hypothetical protein
VTRAGSGTAASRSRHTAEQLHVAFAVAAADIGAWERRLLGRGLAIERTIDWRPGVCGLCVRDPDRHLVEMATPGVWGPPCRSGGPAGASSPGTVTIVLDERWRFHWTHPVG